MAVPLAAARPLDVGGILDETFRIYRRRFGLFVTLAALPYAAWLPADLALRALVGPDERWVFEWVGTGLVPGTLAWSACTWAVWRLSAGEAATAPAAFGATWRRLPALALISLVSGVVAPFLCLTIVGIRWAVGWSLATAALFA